MGKAALSIENVSHTGGIADRVRVGSNAAHYMRTAPAVLGSWDVVAVCGPVVGSSTDAALDMGQGVDGPLCKRCDGIYSRMLDAQESAGQVDDVTAPDPFAPEEFAANPAPGAPAGTAEGRSEYVWHVADGDGADYVAVSGMVDTVTGTDHVYVVESGGMWHAGSSVPIIGAQWYAQGETPDVAVRVLRIKVKGTDAPGAVSDATPGNTSRVDAALKRATAVAAERERRERQAAERETRKAKQVAAPTLADVIAMRKAVEMREAAESDAVPVKRARRKAVVVPDRNNAETLAVLDPAPSPRAVAAEDIQRDREAADKFLAAQRAAQITAIRRTTDSKCAVALPLEDGTGERLVTLSGRMALADAEAIAELVGCDVIPVGKLNGALAPRDGSVSLDADNNDVGVCPVCAQEYRLTGSGGIGTHRPDGSTPSGPVLTQREVPAVDRNGEPTRAASKKREAEAAKERAELTVSLPDDAPAERVAAAVLAAVKGDRKASGVKSVGEAVRVPVADSGKAPVGVRDLGRSDGVAMLPIGETGYAGMKFDDGGTFDLDGQEVDAVGVLFSEIKGGMFGHLTFTEYGKLSKAGRRDYRRKVAKLEARWHAANRAQRHAVERAQMAIIGRMTGSGLMERVAEREAEIKAAAAAKRVKIGSTAEGQTHSHHVGAGTQDVTVFPVIGSEGRAGRGSEELTVSGGK